MIRSRKGVGLEGAIITLVVFGAVFLILTLGYLGLFDSSKRVFSDKECQASLLLTRAVDSKISVACMKPVDNPVPIKCARHFFTVTDNTVVDTSGKKAKDVSATYACSDGSASCLASHLVAEEMRRCWTMFGEGEYPAFQQVDQLFDWNNNNRACFICGEVTIKTKQDVTKFKEYLQNTPIPGTGADRKMYFDVLAGNPKAICPPELEKDGTCWEAMANLDDLPIDQETLRTGQTYAIAFVRRGLSRAAEDGTCSITDTQKYPTLTVQAIPADDIPKQCGTVLT
jgi:hypothetical protein